MALRALEIGAVDVFTQPALNVMEDLSAMQLDLTSRIRAAAKIDLNTIRSVQTLNNQKPAAKTTQAMGQTTHQILAIAASTGGTEALKVVLNQLPPDLPGTVIVQHMPPVFTTAFANNLNRICAFDVREAQDGDRLTPGLALIAPGNFHMELSRSGAYYYVKLHQEPALHGVRPAADYLMKSVARIAGKNAIGLVLTGMGRDGADGLLEMRKAGARTFAQDEASSVVYGMPKVAAEVGAVEYVLGLDDIATALMGEFRRRAWNFSGSLDHA